MYRLENPILYYDWGSTTTIPHYLGNPTNGEPHAEVWMGAHPSAPSLATHACKSAHGTTASMPSQGSVALSEIIAANPRALLGDELTERFGPQLPFLAKLLAADKPLSLQVHPTRERAEQQYHQEIRQGTAKHMRNYMDPNHKPELLMALAPTLALVGFRFPDDAAATVSRLKSASALQIVELLQSNEKAEDCLRAAFTACLDLSEADTAQIVSELPPPLAWPDPKDPLQVASALAHHHPGDPGSVASLLLNTVLLEPGQGLYVPSGSIHAYIRGFGLEVMASSDNVLRAGLTSKRVDREELLEAASFKPGAPQIVTGQPHDDATCTVYTYHTPENDFSLKVIERLDVGARCEADATQIDGLGARIVICIDGVMDVEGSSCQLQLGRGDSAFIGAEDGLIKIRGTGRLAVVGAEA